MQKSSLGYCTIEIVEIDIPFPKRRKCPEQTVVQIILNQMQPGLRDMTLHHDARLDRQVCHTSS